MTNSRRLKPITDSHALKAGESIVCFWRNLKDRDHDHEWPGEVLKNTERGVWVRWVRWPDELITHARFIVQANGLTVDECEWFTVEEGDEAK